MDTRPPATRRRPRQARAAETRRRLLDAAFEAFAAKGFDRVNLVDDVLEPAGISIGSFYHQFADKTELLGEVLAEAAARRRSFIAGLGSLDRGADLGSDVRAVVERLVDSLETDAAAWQLQRATRIATSGRVRQLGGGERDNWTEGLATMLAAWYGAPLSARRAASDLVITFARGLIAEHLDTPLDKRRDRTKWATDATAFIVGGLTAMLGDPAPTAASPPPHSPPPRPRRR
jgi:AcrR family transcriptional regulator